MVSVVLLAIGFFGAGAAVSSGLIGLWLLRQAKDDLEKLRKSTEESARQAKDERDEGYRMLCDMRELEKELMCLGEEAKDGTID